MIARGVGARIVQAILVALAFPLAYAEDLPVAPAPTISSITLSPNNLIGGAVSTATITLDQPAPAGGSEVALSTSATYASVPASILVASGQTSATFPIVTRVVSWAVELMVNASLGAATKYAPLTLRPAAKVAAYAFSPTSVIGGDSSTATVTLDAPAPPSGLTVQLQIFLGDPVEQRPDGGMVVRPLEYLSSQFIVFVPGQTSGTVPVSTRAVTTPTFVMVADNSGLSAVLRVMPATSIANLSLSPATVVGGGSSTATLTLAQPAPSGGMYITLGSTAGAGSVPPGIVIPAGQTSGTFPVSTPAVRATTIATITAANGAKSAQLTLTAPATVASVSLSPASVVGGQASTLTVTLDQPAPAGGLNVALGSSAATTANAPANFTIAAGQTFGTVSITTQKVAAAAMATISAMGNAVSRSAQLTVTPELTVAPVAANDCSRGCFTATVRGAKGGRLRGMASVEQDDGDRFRVVFRHREDEGHYLALTRESGGVPRTGDHELTSTCGEALYKADAKRFRAEYFLNDYREEPSVEFSGKSGSMVIKEIDARHLTGTFTITACHHLGEERFEEVNIRGEFDAARP